MDEGQTEALLERAQAEVFSVRQKLDGDLKQEKRRLRQKLIVRRRREVLQKVPRERRRVPPAQPSPAPAASCPRGGRAAVVPRPLRRTGTHVLACCAEKGSAHPFRSQEGAGSWWAREASLGA